MGAWCLGHVEQSGRRRHHDARRDDLPLRPPGFFVEFRGGVVLPIAVFLPFDERICQVIMLAVALIYTMLSGLYGVVWTDVLPRLLAPETFPAGVRGLLIAALLVAAMSTFDSTINAGASYVVRDLYQPLRPSAPQRELVRAGYAASLGIVLAGLFLAWQVESVLGFWVALLTNLFPAFLVPFALRRFWGRFNGAGFTAGVLAGFAAAFGCHLAAASGHPLHELANLAPVAGASACASVLVTLVAAPTPVATARAFHQKIHPMGWWPSEWNSPHRSEHRADLLRLAAALLWQIATFLLPMVLMLRMWAASAVLAAIWLVCGFALLRTLLPPGEERE